MVERRSRLCPARCMSPAALSARRVPLPSLLVRAGLDRDKLHVGLRRSSGRRLVGSHLVVQDSSWGISKQSAGTEIKHVGQGNRNGGCTTLGHLAHAARRQAGVEGSREAEILLERTSALGPSSSHPQADCPLPASHVRRSSRIWLAPSNSSQASSSGGPQEARPHWRER